jgi:protein-S-isoprenylcysteine O-methyltransferase Ste14
VVDSTEPDNRKVEVEYASLAHWPPFGLLARVWHAVPDWTFRAIGAAFFLGYFILEARDYLRHGFWGVGHYFRTGETTHYQPYARVLIDLTLLLIGLAFIFRLPPRRRAARPSEIILPIIAAFWPFLPFALLAALRVTDPARADAYFAFMFDFGDWTPSRFFIGSGLLIVGAAIDVWGYTTLFRSISIVAEARELKTGGPYRWIRHPIYLGQFIAQTGLWLFYARRHPVWIAFCLAFIAMQLWRSRVEERVLENAFGEQYRAYKKRSFWFV